MPFYSRDIHSGRGAARTLVATFAAWLLAATASASIAHQGTDRGPEPAGPGAPPGPRVVADTETVAGSAEAREAKIVGIGATTCARYLAQIEGRPQTERDFIAWAQGFMSGVLLRAPPGRDEGLDLMPKNFSVQKQANFLRRWCENNKGSDFSDGVLILYRTLRAPSGWRARPGQSGVTGGWVHG